MMMPSKSAMHTAQHSQFFLALARLSFVTYSFSPLKGQKLGLAGTEKWREFWLGP
jgi:hypothetical protein